jgi:hypothetical protein
LSQARQKLFPNVQLDCGGIHLVVSSFPLQSRSSRKWLDHHIVNVTPSPVFARLKRSHDRVLCLFEVLGGVPVLRGIAAADMAANFANAQMHP